MLNLEEPLVLAPEQVVDFFVQVPDLQFGFQVHFVIVLRLQAVAGLGAVLAHHDDGRLQRGDAGEDQVKEDEGIGVETAISERDHIERDPAEQDDPENDDKTPTAAKLGDAIREAFAEGELALELLVDVFREQLVLLQALDHFLVERGEFAQLVLEGAFDVIAAHPPQVFEADKVVQIPIRPLLVDEFREGGPDGFAHGAVPCRFQFFADGAGEILGLAHGGTASLSTVERAVDCALNWAPLPLLSAAMEEAEVPLEHLHEHTQHAAEHGGVSWISGVALSTAILAVLAAIAGLLSGMHVNEAMMSQIEAANRWSYFQAKGIKAAVLDAKMTLGATPTEQDREKAARYLEEQSEIQKEARAKETEAKQNFHEHEIFARAVTMFQIAIAIAAISALTKRRRYWFVSLALGAAGGFFLALGFLAH